MIKETYIDKVVKNKIPVGDLIYVVTYKTKSPLAPSRELDDKWRNRIISEKEFKREYLKEIRRNPQALALLEKIALISAYKDVWLVSEERDGYCHRHILKELVEKCIKEKDKSIKDIINEMMKY